MRATFRLGRVRGVPVGAHWSVLATLALFADVLAVGILPQAVPGASHVAYWSTAIVVAVLFMASLLAHEVAHALTARRHNVPVMGITLWMLGGVTQLEGESPDGATELRIAIAGPAVSLACALGGGLLGALLHLTHMPGTLVAGSLWWAASNGLLAVFNMLPGSPLDGGRVFRALIWRRTGDRDRATIAAARTGRLTGWTLGIIGAAEMFLTGDLAGSLWLIIIGFFLLAAANTELAVTEREAGLAGATVAEAMDPDLTSVPDYLAVSNAARHAVEAGADFCLVVDLAGQPVGVVGVDELVQAARRTDVELRVRNCAVPIRPDMRVGPDEQLTEALRRAAPAFVLVVVRDTDVVGLVTPRTIDMVRRRHLLVDAADAR